LHGLWLLVFVALLPGLLTLVPTASLAAVLVVAVFKLINVKALREIWQHDRREFAIYAATATTIVFGGVLQGVLLGVGLAVAKLLYTVGRLDVRREDDPENQRTFLYLQGTATFLGFPKLAKALESVSVGTELHVHFEELSLIDHACLELLINWERRQENTGGSLVLDWESLRAKFRNRMGKEEPEKAQPGPFATGGSHGPARRRKFFRSGWRTVRSPAGES
jgi:MFS superfamily sulfate permease-like transporter